MVVATSAADGNRIKIFVDYWNLDLTLKEQLESLDSPNPYYRIDWLKLPQVLIAKCATTCSLTNPVFSGMHVFSSYDRGKSKDLKHKTWMENWLDRQPGTQVVLKRRQRRHPPKCRMCNHSIETCPNCGHTLSGTTEKGVDSAIVTDMIRFAWEDAYDIAVLVSSDSDLVPPVEFLVSRNLKVVQAGFPPKGSYLAKSCWDSFDLFELRSRFERTYR